MILPPPDESSQRRIKRSRVLSYVLVLLAAVVLSLRPDLFGDPQVQPWHALLHGWRIALGLVLALAAAAVQIVVGVQWRQGLRRAADENDPDGFPTGPRAPGNTGPRAR